MMAIAIEYLSSPAKEADGEERYNNGATNYV